MSERGKKDRTHGNGRERIRTVQISETRFPSFYGKRLPSVIISDHACARNIALVSMQESTAAPQPVQLTDIGKH